MSYNIANLFLLDLCGYAHEFSYSKSFFTKHCEISSIDLATNWLYLSHFIIGVEHHQEKMGLQKCYKYHAQEQYKKATHLKCLLWTIFWISYVNLILDLLYEPYIKCLIWTLISYMDNPRSDPVLVLLSYVDKSR